MELEVAKIEDVKELSVLLNYLFQQETEFKPNKEAQNRGLSTIISNPEMGKILIARESDKIIGMVNLLYTFSTALGESVAILEDMVVIPEVRNSGVGSKLLNYAIEFAKNNRCKRITLLTDEDNEKAHKFYKRNGFDRSSMIAFRRMKGL